MKNIITVCVIYLMLFACGNKQKKDTSIDTLSENINFTNENIVTLTEEQLKNVGIETGKASIQNISSVLKLNGKIDVPPQSLISISVPLGGYLKSTKLLNGMHINKGEVLAVMEDIQYIQLQQDYLTTKAQFSFTEKEYFRQKELNLSKATSDKAFEQAKSNYYTQLVLIKSLEEKLKLIGLNPNKITSNNISNKINIYSPITGFVSAVNVNIGKYVTSSDVLFELVNPSDIHLNLTVFEKDINKLSLGQKLKAFTNTNPDKKYNCEIILLSKNLENNNSTQIHCHFEQYDKCLLPGMYMNAEIELAENIANTLPENAIVRYNNKHYVFVVLDKNKFEMTEVRLGKSENGYTEIILNNIPNKTFVTKGAYTLLMTIKNKSE